MRVKHTALPVAVSAHALERFQELPLVENDTSVLRLMAGQAA
jgi:hypothetical protein